MDYINKRPISTPRYPASVHVWIHATHDFYIQVEVLKNAREVGHIGPFKKEDWRSAWKTARALYYFYQHEVKPRSEEYPELTFTIAQELKWLGDSMQNLKVLYRFTSRNKLWARN